ncbi:MAG TPA: hypothetical protein VIA61_07770 [Methylomirabilota bacterium]
MSLKAELKALQTRLESGRSAEAVATMHRAVDELRTAKATDRVLKVGDRAPSFRLPNAAEQPIDSGALLARGPLVVTFYRGRW